MTDLELFNLISSLNPAQKKEVSAFVRQLKSKHNSKIKDRKFGCAKGFFKMAPDFDELLNDFQAYS